MCVSYDGINLYVKHPIHCLTCPDVTRMGSLGKIVIHSGYGKKPVSTWPDPFVVSDRRIRDREAGETRSDAVNADRNGMSPGAARRLPLPQ